MNVPDDLFDLKRGESAVILSIPHAGTRLPEDIRLRLTDEACTLPDTDWHVDRLYGFASGLGATVIKANYSRYLIDLNRPASNESLYPGQATTGLCPQIQFDGSPLYRENAILSQEEISSRIRTYWRPYHLALVAELKRVHEKHGFAVLYDCHSIASRVPRLFEGTLPVFNLGTVNGSSCAPELEQQSEDILAGSGMSWVVNGRFIGGHITRTYGQPATGLHALQMELGCDAYLSDDGSYAWDDDKAAHVIPVLSRVVCGLLEWRP